MRNLQITEITNSNHEFSILEFKAKSCRTRKTVLKPAGGAGCKAFTTLLRTGLKYCIWVRLSPPHMQYLRNCKIANDIIN